MKPYFSFDHTSEAKAFLEKFKNLHRDISIGIAKSEKQLFISAGADGESETKLITYAQPGTWKDPRISSDFGTDLESLSTGELKEFFRVFKSHIFNSYFIPIRSHAEKYDFTKSFNAKDTKEHENIKFFKPLVDLLPLLPFQEIGRVFLIYTPPHQKEIWHIDYWPGKFYDGTRHFMWISNKKNLQLEIEGVKTSVDSQAMMFNFGLKHSTPFSEESSYSLRIEGHFKKDFCERENIKWKSR